MAFSISAGAVGSLTGPFCNSHFASTLPGMSGSPIMHAGKVVGIHLGTSTVEPRNEMARLHPIWRLL